MYHQLLRTKGGEEGDATRIDSTTNQEGKRSLCIVRLIRIHILLRVSISTPQIFANFIFTPHIFESSTIGNKQSVVPRSGAKSKFQGMANIACELVWIQQLQKLGNTSSFLMQLYCDNQPANHMASNLVFHETTRCIKNDCHLVREKVIDEKNTELRYVIFTTHLAGLFTKITCLVYLKQAGHV